MMKHNRWIALLLSIAMMLAMLPGMAFAAEENDALSGGYAAQVGGEKYETLSEALRAVAEDGGAVRLLEDCAVANEAFVITGNVKITGEYHIDIDSVGIALKETGALTLDRCSAAYTGESGADSYNITMQGQSAFNLTDGASFEVSGSGKGVFYTYGGTQINVDASTFYLHDISGTAMMNEPVKGVATYGKVKITNGSVFSIDNVPDAGQNGMTMYEITVDDSQFSVTNCAYQGLVNTKLTLDASEAAVSGNRYGITSRSVDLKNGSALVMKDNSQIGIWHWQGPLTVRDGCRLLITGTGAGWTAETPEDVEHPAAIVAYYPTANVVFEDGAAVSLTDNHCRAIKNMGTVSLGAGTAIERNGDNAVRGGGIYNKNAVTMHEGAALYNNHAALAGDDIFNTENAVFNLRPVGGGWALDGAPDCADPITGWFDDAEGARWQAHDAAANHLEEYAVTAGTEALSGEKSLKAAHGLIGSISGAVFDDTDRDDKYTAADKPVAGHAVTLYEKRADAAGAETWVRAAAGATDENGAYRFDGLKSGGVYRVETMRPDSLNRDCAVTYSPETPNGNRFAPVGEGYATDEITILPDADQPANAGFYKHSSGSISGAVFDDTDRDDKYTAADKSVAGHAVTLYEKRADAAGAETWVRAAAGATDENGAYRFDGLKSGGVYRVGTMRPDSLNRDCAVTYSPETPNGNRFAPVGEGYATDEITILPDADQPANAGFYYHSSGGNSGGGTPPTIEEPEVPLAPGLNKDDHFAYIIGYPQDYVTGEPTADKNRWPVRPEANIDRQEVATIFFRLLTDESRTEAWSQTNDFADVKASQWSNNAISTMAKAGIVNGYRDGTFRPAEPITRAEFAAIAARFESSLYVGDDQFSDISGHWAAEYINRAAQKGWVKGYHDGTFRPDQLITRAEAMTLVNAVLDRRTHAPDMLDDMTKWPDNPADAWYYEAVQEATNSHDYDRENPTAYEEWTVMQPARDWALLEREWSVAAAKKA